MQTLVGHFETIYVFISKIDVASALYSCHTMNFPINLAQIFRLLDITFTAATGIQ